MSVDIDGHRLLVQTDALGRFHLATALPTRTGTGPERDVMRVARATRGPDGDISVWVAHQVDLRVTLEIDDRPGGPLPDALRVLVRRNPGMVSHINESPAPEVVSNTALESMGIRVRRSVEFEPGQRVASLRVPFLQGSVVTASAPGYRPALERIAPDPDMRSAQAHLLLQRVRKMRGTVRDEDGVQLEGVPVIAWLWKRIPRDQVPMDELRGMQERGAVMVGTRGDYAITRVAVHSITDAGGEWEVDLVYDGTIVVIAHGKARPPRRRTVGWGEVDAVHLTLEPRTDAEVQLRLDGEPLADAKVSVTDITDDVQTSAPYLYSDKEGMMSAAVFHNRRTYHLWVRRDRESWRTKIVWGGAATIELASGTCSGHE